MKFIRSLSKFAMELLPLVLASIISSALLVAMQLAPGPAAPDRRAGAETAEPTVYVDVLPRIQREPVRVIPITAPAPAPAVPATAASAQVQQPPAAEESATPVQTALRPDTATAPATRERATRNAVAAHAASAAARVESASKTEPAPALPPPMSIVSAAQNEPPAGEPARVLGMPVPEPVSQVGGRVVGVAKVPLDVAHFVVARPALWAGGKIVEKVVDVAGWIIPDLAR